MRPLPVSSPFYDSRVGFVLRPNLTRDLCRKVEEHEIRDFWTTTVTVVNFLLVSVVLVNLLVAMLSNTIDRIGWLPLPY